MNIARHTYAQDAYAAIRGLILDGSLSPGSKMVVRMLAERLGLSPTPIKAALNALEREGFVTAIPHRGFYVSQVSAGDMQEIYELREVLDGIAARKAAASVHHRELSARLARLLDRQQRLVEPDVQIGYSDLDVAFHHAILEVASNTRLQQVANNLIAQVRIGSGSSSQLPGRLPTALHEHAAIIEAIEAGDPIAAEREARHHVRLAGEALQSYFAEIRANGNAPSTTKRSPGNPRP